MTWKEILEESRRVSVVTAYTVRAVTAALIVCGLKLFGFSFAATWGITEAVWFILAALCFYVGLDIWWFLVRLWRATR